MRSSAAFALLLPLLAAAAPVSAETNAPENAAVLGRQQPPASDFAFGTDLGTFGWGMQAAVRVAPRVDLRASDGTFNYGMNGTASGFAYNGSLHLSTFAGLVDVHPFSNPFRLTTGIVSGGNWIGFNAQTNSMHTVVVNGHTYTQSEVGSVFGKAQFGGTNPYLGVGFGDGRGRRGSLSFYGDAGVVLEPSAAVSIGTTLDNLPPQGQAVLAADLRSAKAQMQNDLTVVRTYPVVRFGVQFHP